MDRQGLSFQVCRTLEELQSAEAAEMVLLEGLGNNLIKQIGAVELDRPIKIFVRDQAGRVVGGVIAHVFGGWVYIALLWMEESWRNLGYGTRLMHLAEVEALQLGCQYAHVDTYSFEARPFYERLGYELFATLDDYPQGHSKHFLKKRLAVKEI